MCPSTASDPHYWWCKRGGLLQVLFLFLQFGVRSDRRNNYTLVTLFQTLIPFIPRPRCLSLDYASSRALISLYKRQKAVLYRNVKKSWQTTSKYCIFLPYFYFFISPIPSVICYRVPPKKYGGKVNNFKPISHTENSVFLR